MSGKGGALVRFLQTTLLGGLAVVLPVSLGILLLEQMIQSATTLALPFAQVMPFLHDRLAAHARLAGLVALLVVSFLAGLLAYTAPARRLGVAVEQAILNRIPFYPILRQLAQRVSGERLQEQYVPALLDAAPGIRPLVFIIEWHPDSKATVLLPTAPTVIVGQIMVVDAARLTVLDAGIPQILKAVSRWGHGLAGIATKP